MNFCSLFSPEPIREHNNIYSSLVLVNYDCGDPWHSSICPLHLRQLIHHSSINVQSFRARTWKRNPNQLPIVHRILINPILNVVRGIRRLSKIRQRQHFLIRFRKDISYTSDSILFLKERHVLRNLWTRKNCLTGEQMQNKKHMTCRNTRAQYLAAAVNVAFATSLTIDMIVINNKCLGKYW